MKNIKLINALKVTAFVVIMFVLSYFTFMAFQGLNTSIVSYFKDFFPYIGSILNIFILPAFAVFMYRVLFSKQDSRRFMLKNGYYLAISAFLGTVFMIIHATQYKNWGFGITWCYPIDFLVIDLIICVVGVLTILKGYKMEKKEYVKPEHHIKQIFLIALMYVYIFITLDRFGAFEMSIIMNPGKGVEMVLPLYCTLISPMILALGFMINKVQHPVEHVPSKLFCGTAFASLGVAIIGFIFSAVNVFGPNASDYMRIASPFFALDRLASLPILITLLTLLSVAIPLAFTIHIVKVFAKQKKEKVVEAAK